MIRTMTFNLQFVCEFFIHFAILALFTAIGYRRGKNVGINLGLMSGIRSAYTTMKKEEPEAFARLAEKTWAAATPEEKERAAALGLKF